MTNAFDNRIVRLGIEIDGDLKMFEGLDIRAIGQKFASPQSSVCIIKVSNLTREQKNLIMTRATPMLVPNDPNAAPIPVTLDVGRQSKGTFRLFEGTCWASHVTMPPDIGITLMSTTNNLAASFMQSVNMGETASLKAIASSVATSFNLILNFTATDRQIANFHWTGGLQMAMNKLARAADVRVFSDGKVLSVWDNGMTIGGADAFTLSAENGMIGIPEVTQSGVKVRMLIDARPRIGGPITIKSLANPAVNGNYVISTINYELTSRDDPFWYEVYCDNLHPFQAPQ